MAQTVSVPGIGDLEFPDDMSQADMSAAIQKNFPQIHKPQAPTGEFGTGGNVEDIPGLSPPVVRQPVPQRSLAEKAIGAGEAALTMGTGATSGLLGSMAGSVSGIGKSVLSGQFGTQAGSDLAAQEAASTARNLTYEPRSQAGQEYIGNIGEIAEPLAGLTPFTQEAAIIGRAGRAALPQAENTFNAISGKAQNRDIAERIGAGATERDLAPFMLPESAQANSVASPPLNLKAIKDVAARDAIKQGFDDAVIQSVKQASPTDKAKMLRMATIAEKSKNDARFAAENRASDVAGDSLVGRIKFLKSTNQKAANEIDEAAGKIQGKPVDYEPALQQFRNDLEAAGVTVGDNGALNFKGSDLEFSPGDRKLITDVYRRAQTIDGSDAFKVHKLKRLIDTTVDYGKGSQKGVTNSGENIVKGFRRSVDATLDNAFEDYNIANTKYADTISELNDFQKAAGSTVNLFGENSDKAIGTVSRRLLSNTQSRVNLMDSIKSMNETSKKYGAEFNDDIMNQVMFADELDRIFGTQAKTSLQGDVGKGVKRAFDMTGGSRTLTGTAVEGAAALAEKARGINQQNAFKSIKRLLARDAAKEEEK